jgi:hypothetical protein
MVLKLLKTFPFASIEGGIKTSGSLAPTKILLSFFPVEIFYVIPDSSS